MEIRRSILTVDDCVILSSVSRSTIYAAIKSGELPAKKKRRWTRIYADDFERWLGAPLFPARTVA
jgi:excisionase family DNA binding protein